MFPQILRHLLDAVPVHDFIGWFPVRVCAAYQIRVGNHADAADIPVLELPIGVFSVCTNNSS